MSSADRETAVADTHYGRAATVRALHGRLHGVSRDMAPGDVFNAVPRACAPSPDAYAKPKTGGSYASAKRPAQSTGKRAQGVWGLGITSRTAFDKWITAKSLIIIIIHFRPCQHSGMRLLR